MLLSSFCTAAMQLCSASRGSLPPPDELLLLLLPLLLLLLWLLLPLW
jgi:hypothetical protein